MTYPAILRSSRLKLLTRFFFKEDPAKKLYPHGYSYGITPRPARALLHDPLAGIPARTTVSRRPTNFQEA